MPGQYNARAKKKKNRSLFPVARFKIWVNFAHSAAIR